MNLSFIISDFFCHISFLAAFLSVQSSVIFLKHAQLFLQISVLSIELKLSFLSLLSLLLKLLLPQVTLILNSLDLVVLVFGGLLAQSRDLGLVVGVALLKLELHLLDLALQEFDL